MEAEVAAAMDAGAFGITSALIFPPNSFQSTADLTRLARVAARRGGYYSAHMRDESSKLLGGVAEAIAMRTAAPRRCAAWPTMRTRAYPAGIGEVIVNGQVALARGEPTGSRSGTPLRHQCVSPRRPTR